MAQADVCHVHRAASALAVTRLLAEQFRHHQFGFATSSQEVSMSSVGAGDVVIFTYRCAGAYCHRLLTDADVAQSGNPCRRMQQ